MDSDIGVDEFEFWTPIRRPNGPNMAFILEKPLPFYKPESIVDGYFRPINEPHAWAAEMDDLNPKVTLSWKEKKEITSIKLFFDTDFDHAMETSQWPHPEDRVPYVVKEYRISDDNGTRFKEITDNYQTINEHKFKKPIVTNKLEIEFTKWNENVPVSLMGIICK